METNAMDIEFQADIQRLNLLSGNADTLEAFTKEYERILTENYNSMMQCRNVDKLLKGIYRHRASMLKAMLQRQLDHLGLTWPDTTRKAISGR